MAQPIRPRPKERSRSISSSSKDHVDSSSSRDKKILPGRRQQRHSTEIGSEYHRWWVVRNVLGFETNEHIAGLLLDSLHSTLQQLVVTCGGEVYNPDIHGLENLGDGHNTPGRDASTASASAAASSSATGSSLYPSPPGFIEDVDEFLFYKSAIGHYCEYLWVVCIIQDRLQTILFNLSTPIQQFVVKLLGYLRTARGRGVSNTQKKRRSKAASARKADEKDQLEVPEIKSTHSTLLQNGQRFGRQSNIPEFPSGRGRVPHELDDFINCRQEDSNSLNHWQYTQVSSRNRAGSPVSCQDSSRQSLNNRGVDSNPSYLSDSGDMEVKGGNKDCSDDVAQICPRLQSGCPQEVDKSYSIHKQEAHAWDLSSEERFVSTECDSVENKEKSSKYKKLHDDHKLRCEQAEEDWSLASKWTGSRNNPSQAYQEISSRKACNGRDYMNFHSSKKNRSGPFVEETGKKDWPEFHAHSAPTKTEGTSSSPCSLLSPPSVYLDRDVDPAPEAETSPEAFPVQRDDRCLKSLLSKPVKIQSVNTPQFVNGDGTAWQGPHDFTKRADSETKSALSNPGGDFNYEKRPVNSISKANGTLSQNYQIDTQTLPTDLSVKADDNFGENSQRYSIANRRQTGPTSRQDNQTSGSNSSTPATLVYAASGLQPHPLGTPVILYPAGGFPSADNSLASLPTLVQNIMYNSSGATLLQPLSDPPMHSKSGTSQPVYPASSNHNVISTLASGNRAAPPVSGPPMLMSMYMPGHPRSDTPCHPASAASTASSGRQSASGSSFPFINASTSSYPHASRHVPVTASSTKLYQEWGGDSAPLPSGPAVNTETSASKSAMHFKITNVRSCGDADFSSTHQSKAGPENRNFFKASSIKEDTSSYTDPGNQTYTECQGLSGCKLSILPSTKESVMPNKGSSHRESHHSNSSSNKNFSSTVKSEHKEAPMTCAQVKTDSGPAFHARRASSSSRKRQSFSSAQGHSKPLNFFQSSQTQTPLHTGSSEVSATVTSLGKVTPPSSQQDKPSKSAKALSQLDSSTCTPSKAPDVPLKQAAPLLKTLPPPAAPVWPSSRSSRRLMCTICELVFPSGTDLLLHRYEQHSLVCGECDSRFLSTSGLLRHKETDHPPILRCPQCRFVTFSREEHACHVASEHLNKQESGLEKQARDTEHLDGKLHSSNDKVLSSVENKMIESKYEPAQENFQKSSSDPKPLATARACNVLEHNVTTSSSKAWLTQTDASESSPRNKTNYDDGASSNDQGHLKLSETENMVSESEEPPLVIDTSEHGEFDKREIEVPASSYQFDGTDKEQQPLCLVTHGRMSDLNEFSCVVAAQSKKSESFEQLYDSTDVKGKITNKDNKEEKLCIAIPNSSGNGNASVNKQDGHLISAGFKKRKRAHVSVAANYRRKLRKTTTNTSANLKTSSRKDGKSADGNLSTSSHCFSSAETSLEAAKRDTWNTGGIGVNSDSRHTPTKADQIFEPCSLELAKEGSHGNAQPAQTENTVQVRADASNKDQMASQNTSGRKERQALTLRDRHTMSSLPPKKRGFRKSPRSRSVSSSSIVNTSNANLNESSGDGAVSQNNLEIGASNPLHWENGSRSNKDPAKSEEGIGNRETKFSMSPYLVMHAKLVKKKQFLNKGSRKQLDAHHQGRRTRRNSEAVLRMKTSPREETRLGSTPTVTAQGGLQTPQSRRSYKCPDPGCSSSFSRKWSMEVHHDRVHRKDGAQLICHYPSCHRKCSNRRELREHVLETHQGKVRRYTCTWPDCGRGFFARTHLQTHVLVHTGEKPVACDLCDYRCRQRTALIWHMRKHGIYRHRSAAPQETSSSVP